MSNRGWLGWIVLFAAAAAWIARALPHIPAAPLQDAEPPRVEAPGDPPGEPAHAPEGALPAPPIAFGPYVAQQVNVGAGGANIPGDAANEPSIAVDPTDPDNLVIGWRQFDTVASNFRQAGRGYSHDGGRTWTFPGVLDPGVFRSDPVLAADASGSFLYNAVTIVPGNLYQCAVFKSTDRGVTFGPAVYSYGGDKAWMTVDTTASQGAGHVYGYWSRFAGCCGTNVFNRSTNAAGSFEPPVPILGDFVWGTLDVTSDGRLFLGGVVATNFSMFAIARSSDARNAAATPSFDLTAQVNLGGTLLYSVAGSPNPGGLLGQVWIATDRSTGPTAGNVYLLCSVDPPGSDPLDLRFSRSTDGGATWSPSVRVNDDPANNGAWQWFGTLAVAPNGRIDVVWNDTRNTGAANMSQLFTSSSTDAGVTWSANQALTPAWNSHVGWPNQDKIGDYYDMVSDAVGADLAFAATFNGEQDVYYMRLGDRDCNQNGIGDSIDIALGTSLDTNGDGIPDECQCPVTSYCTAKTNSLGCVPFMVSGGLPSATVPSGFLLRAEQVLPGKVGLLIYSTSGPGGSPFQGGYLCVSATVKRTPGQISGSAGSPPCTGTYSFDFNARIASGVDPSLASGQQVWTQYWSRDGAASFGTGLTNAVTFDICP